MPLNWSSWNLLINYVTSKKYPLEFNFQGVFFNDHDEVIIDLIAQDVFEWLVQVSC